MRQCRPMRGPLSPGPPTPASTGKADPASIEAILRSHEVFVEESFTALLNRLGFPEAAEPADQATV